MGILDCDTHWQAAAERPVMGVMYAVGRAPLMANMPRVIMGSLLAPPLRGPGTREGPHFFARALAS